MRTKQTIAIIGATAQVGAALAQSLVTGNYRLLLCAGDGAQVGELAAAIQQGAPVADIEAMDCSMQAAWEADIIILAVPCTAQKEVAATIREVANQKVVISLANPLLECPEEGPAAAGSSAAAELQQLLPHAKVVKAFPATGAGLFDPLPTLDDAIDVFIAGNDAAALQTAAELVQALGCHPVVAGTLPVS